MKREKFVKKSLNVIPIHVREYYIIINVSCAKMNGPQFHIIFTFRLKNIIVLQYKRNTNVGICYFDSSYRLRKLKIYKIKCDPYQVNGNDK